MIFRRIAINSQTSAVLMVLIFFSTNIAVTYSRSVLSDNERSSRLVREVYPEDVTSKQAKVCIVGDVVYGAGESVESQDPCQQCTCRPPGVECIQLQCPPATPGCRALHRPDKCCPSYQCECTVGNRTYANGERLEENVESPCKVCYCRGGEIQCANVGCYIRDDCEPVQVPGQCCPRYDNCPPRDQSSSTTELTSMEILNESWPINATSSSEEFSAEIKSFEELPQSSEQSTQNTTIDKEYSSSEIGSKELSGEFRPKITIKEILPEVTEYPVIAPPKREISVNRNFNSNSEKPLKISIDSIEINQPSGIRIIYKNGNDLSSTPSSIIDVFGAEGLQIGGIINEDNQDEFPEVSSTSNPLLNNLPVDNYSTQDSLNLLENNLSNDVFTENKFETSLNQDKLLELSTENSLLETENKTSDQIQEKLIELSTENSLLETSNELLSSMEQMNKTTVQLNDTESLGNETVPEEVPLPVIPLSEQPIDEINIAEENPAYPATDDNDDFLNIEESNDHSVKIAKLSDSELESTLSSILNDTSEESTDFSNNTNNSTENSVESTSELNIAKSKEILEDSGEQVTPINQISLPISKNEDASVHMPSETSDEVEIFNETVTISNENSGEELHSEEQNEVKSNSTEVQDDVEVFTTSSELFENSRNESTSTVDSMMLEDSSESDSVEFNFMDKIKDEIVKFQLREGANQMDIDILNRFRDFLGN